MISKICSSPVIIARNTTIKFKFVLHGEKPPIATIAGFVASGDLGWSEGSPAVISDWEMSNSRVSEVKDMFGVLSGLAGTTGCAVFNPAVGMNVSHVDEEALIVEGPGGG